MLVSTRRDTAAARAFFVRALRLGPSPLEVSTDRAPVYLRIVEELEPVAWHVTDQYATDEIVNSGAVTRACSGPISLPAAAA